jgi:cation diffusion facilitator CzcD-associated flavoprotein CzcO
MSEHFDVLVVGAGISGIGAGRYLNEECPSKSYVILEAHESFGGTWLIHNYPGVRSDSDLYTFGYKFKPWTNAPIASREEILKYLGEAIEENDLAPHIRYGHEIKSVNWTEESKVWTVQAVNRESGEAQEFTCNFLWMCQGYYRHSEGYTPQWKGMNDFKGQIVHPQTWPEDLDYRDKNVLVIGSGATAATLIPAMAKDSAHITMLQRSPTYFIPGANRNELADTLRQLDIPEEWTHEIVRQNILLESKNLTELALSEPELAKQELIKAAKELLPDDFDVEKHFTPKYKPWSQRIAFVPDGDLFKGIASGDASVYTDHIEKFTEEGVLLQSGEELKADIVVTATGFNLNTLGDIKVSVDGKAVDVADAMTWRGIMYSDIPNMAGVFGYLRTSWTMRADLISEFVCRLLNHMDAKGSAMCLPHLRAEDQDMKIRPFVDPDDFNPGYMQRGAHLMPSQGDHAPWVYDQNYYIEKGELPAADLDDGSLKFS